MPDYAILLSPNQPFLAAFFKHRHTPQTPYRWPNASGTMDNADSITIPTNFRHLDAQRSLVTASLGHVANPGRVAVQITELRPDVQPNGEQWLRIHFTVTVHGAPTEVVAIDFFGMIVGQ